VNFRAIKYTKPKNIAIGIKSITSHGTVSHRINTIVLTTAATIKAVLLMV